MRFKNSLKFTIFFIAIQAINTPATAQFNASTACKAVSGETITPVVELYTSEGCSSCPPAEKWLNTLKGKNRHQIQTANPAVIQAFHVNYWDYIGWPDRFATAAHTNRQRQISAWNKQNGIYTPQMVLNGGDWRGWGSIGPFNTAVPANKTVATSSINLTKQAQTSLKPWLALFQAQIRHQARGQPIGPSPSTATSPRSKRVKTVAKRCCMISWFANTRPWASTARHRLKS